MRRSEGSRASRLDRLAQELTHLSNRSLDRWQRFSDRLADRRARMADHWHRFSDRVAAAWTRLTDRVLDRSYQISDRVSARRTRPTHGVRDRRHRFSDRVVAAWTRLTDGVLDRWYRFSDRVATGRLRLTHRMSGSDGIPFRSPALVVVTLCVLLAISAIALIRPGPDTPVPRDTATDTLGTPAAVDEDPTRRGLSAPGDQLPGYEVHVNEGGGYLFSYPGTWEIASAGDSARLVSPDGDVVMTFRTAPSGSLEEASDRVLRNATGSYSGVELVASEVERTPQGLRSFVVGGDALNATGTPVRFLVITIQGPEENRAITVRFSPSADPLEALPAIREIVSSFRISQAE